VDGRRVRRRLGDLRRRVADYDGFGDLWEPLERGVGPAGAYTVELEPAARADLRADLRRRLGAGDAPFRLTAGPGLRPGRHRKPESRLGGVLREPVRELGDEAVEPAARQPAGAGSFASKAETQRICVPSPSGVRSTSAR
jgi:hypothetical protein